MALTWSLLAASLSALISGGSVYSILRSRWSVPYLRDAAAPPPTVWPLVSLIVPARDEAAAIEAATASRLAQDYPSLELVLVDDRSTDATPAIIDRLAAGDPRVMAVHLTELPAGWLGKLHALDQGVRRARGDWLLFTDADVTFAPDTLRRAVAWCEHGGFDHLAVLPDFNPQSPLLDACLDILVGGLIVGGRLWSVSDPKSSAAVGGGLFGLVRRSAFERTGAFESLRMEVADDVALGQLLKDSGARPTVLNAAGYVSLDFYRSLTELSRGLDKSAFPVIGRFSVARLILMVGLMIYIETGSWLVAAFATDPAARLVGLAAGLTLLGGSVALAGWLHRSLWSSLLKPFASVVFGAMLLRAGLTAWRQGGVDWRGTRYPLAALREGQRVRFP